MPGTGAPLRGRAAERELLRSRIAAASRDGRGSVVLLSGAAGTGKSRLLQEARTLALDVGAQVLLVRGDPDSHVAPHGQVLDAVMSGPRPFVPPDLLDELPPGPDQGHWLRRELHHRLEQAALRAPVLVCIDDLQWCDLETLRLVRLLTSDLSTEAVVWVVALRPKAEPAVRSAVRGLREAGADLMELRPLDAPAVAQITADVLGGLPDQQVLASASRAGGIPLLLVELLRGLRDEGLVRLEAGTARLVADELPARLRDAVTRRTERISADAQQLLQIGAVLGRRFPPDLLAAVMGRPVPDLLRPIQELVDAALLLDDGEQLAFGHDLIRETVAADLPQALARALRRHAVDVLLARGATTVQVAAMLADSAMPGDAEAVAALRHAATALGPTSSPAAAAFAVRALELLPDGAPERAATAAEAIVLLWQAGRAAEAQDLATTALAGALGEDAEAEARIRLGLATFITLHSPLAAVHECETALALPGLPADLRLLLVLVLAANHAFTGEADAAAAALAPAVERLEAAPDPELAAAVARTQSHVAYHRGRWDEAFDLYRDLVGDEDSAGAEVDVWQRTRFPGSDALFVAAMWTAVGEPERALATLEPDLAAARKHERHGPLLWLSGARARVLHDAGRLAEARAEAEAVLAEGDIDVVGGSTDIMIVYTLVRTALRTGRKDVVRAHRDRLHRMTLDPAGQVRRNGLWLTALVADAAGDTKAAMAATREAVATFDRPGPSLAGLNDVMDQVVFVRMALRAGDRDAAEAATRVAERWATTNPTYPMAVAGGLLTRGLVDQEVGLVRDAVQVLAGTPRPLVRADALEDLAVMVAADRPREAVAALDEALGLVDAAGAEVDAARMRSRLRELGVHRRRTPLRAPPEHGLQALTRSELEVVELVVAGGTNRRVAEQLFLSPHTVNTHLRNAFVKLGVRSRVELARLVSANGAG